jgi:hypothetical protein
MAGLANLIKSFLLKRSGRAMKKYESKLLGSDLLLFNNITILILIIAIENLIH